MICLFFPWFSPPISDFDVFKEEKVRSFFESQQAIIVLCTYLQELLKNIEGLDEKLLQEEFFKLLQVKLIGVYYLKWKYVANIFWFEKPC